MLETTATTIIQAHKQQHFQQATCKPNPCRVFLPSPRLCRAGTHTTQLQQLVLHKKGCVRHAAQHGCVQHRIGESKPNKRGIVQGAGTNLAPSARKADTADGSAASLCHRQPAKHCGAAARLLAGAVRQTGNAQPDTGAGVMSPAAAAAQLIMSITPSCRYK
jgi:hypothetical protein